VGHDVGCCLGRVMGRICATRTLIAGAKTDWLIPAGSLEGCIEGFWWPQILKKKPQSETSPLAFFFAAIYKQFSLINKNIHDTKGSNRNLSPSKKKPQPFQKHLTTQTPFQPLPLLGPTTILPRTLQFQYKFFELFDLLLQLLNSLQRPINHNIRTTLLDPLPPPTSLNIQLSLQLLPLLGSILITLSSATIKPHFPRSSRLQQRRQTQER
jgi:hypothetical protein